MNGSWTWDLLDTQRTVVPGGGGGFPTQSDAESWLGEEWRDLLDSGVDAVSLKQDGELVYGPMSLQAME